MCFLPKIARRSKSVNLQIFPPRSFITGLVQLPMMHAAEGYSELITDLETNCPRLGKAQMMRIRGLPPAHHTGLRSDKFQMGLVPQSFRSAIASWLLSILVGVNSAESGARASATASSLVALA